MTENMLTTIAADPGKQEIVITRIFNAPRELVFKVFTDPNAVPKWWGPRRLSTVVDRMEVRPGGVWRFVQRDANGNEFAFHGVYHEVHPPERLVYTFEFEGMPGHVVLETVTFEEVKGGTKLTERSVFQSVEDRDEIVKSGMEEGARETTDRLEELVSNE